jgi:hypothetical protein
MSSQLQGRRVERVGDLEKPGDYTVTSTGSALWFILPDGTRGRVDTDDWTITEHEDKTVTVQPSIHDAPHGWHGFLERGVWRSV